MDRDLFHDTSKFGVEKTPGHSSANQMQMDGLARRASVDGPRQFIKVRGDLGMPTGLRPVQLGHMAPPPLVRINHNLPIPSPPRLTFGGQPRPIGFIQQRPVGSPGNLTGVVNIIPHQARVENGGLKEVLQGVRSPPRQDSSPRPSPPGPLQSKFIDGVVPAVSRPVGRPPLSSSSSSLPAITSGVMGIKNLTPIDTGTSPKMPNLRPVQVRTPIFHHAPTKVSSGPMSNSSDETPAHTSPSLYSATTSTTSTTPKIVEREQIKTVVLNDEALMTLKNNAKNASTAKPSNENDDVEKKAFNQETKASIEASTTSEPAKKPKLQSRFVRRADGKGFVRRDVLRARNRNSCILIKKKKKPFRGVNYRFDGSSIKKRANRKQAAFSDLDSLPSELSPQVKLSEPASVLSYLGIQRRPAEEEARNMVNKPEPKAKKSFRPRPIENSDQVSSNRLSSEITTMSSPDSTMPSRKRGLESTESSSGGNGNSGNSDNQERSSKRPREDDRSSSSTSKDPVKATPQIFVDRDLVCECDKSVTELKIVPEGEKASRCEAVECVGPSKIGCGNPVADKFLRRSGPNLPHLQLCTLHIERLKNHKSCAYCGEFCAQGGFLLCRPTALSPFHMMHLTCSVKNMGKDGIKRCPHCHGTDGIFEVQLKAAAKRMPLTLLSSYAKMSFAPRPSSSKFGGKMNPSNLGRKIVTYTLPSGTVISSEGLPQGLEDEDLAKVIEALEDKDQVKHTTRNMLAPTKAGDNVRLLQLLGLNYSARQKVNDASGGTLLHVAATEGHVLTCHILVQVGAELDALNKEECSPLMVACGEGKVNVVRYLLHVGADMTLRGHDGMTCLHLAAQNGHLECVHAILSQSRLPRKLINETDDGGWTPLVWACENKHEDVIRYLLENGANPLVADADGNIALHWAVLSGSMSSCELLLNHGCDVNTTNKIGDTPMHIALRRDHYECAVLFLMRSARLDIKNENGEVPEDCMILHKNPKCKMIVKLANTINGLMRDKKNERVERVICKDLSRGKETVPIQVVNGVDDEPEPNDYVYVVRNCQTKPMPIDRNIATLKHCQCTDNCAEHVCNCSEDGIKSWYDKDGLLKEDFDYSEPPSIYECNDRCKCNVNLCMNRVLQHGISARLQIVRTEGKGWGVRAMSDIPKGSFVCEYVGEYISDLDAETREDSYLFDLENKDGGETFCIDANQYGNIARFINHNCSPNLVPVKVFVEHQDTRFPHMSLFASRDIPSGEELGFDYGDKFWVVKHKYFTCHCGSEKCRYNKSRMSTFLLEYYKRIKEPMPEDIQELANAAAANNDTETNGKGKKSDKKAKQHIDKDDSSSTKSDPESTSGARRKRTSKQSENVKNVDEKSVVEK